MNKDIYISKGRVPLWRKILGEASTIFIFYLIYWVFEQYQLAIPEKKQGTAVLGVAIVLLLTIITSALLTTWDYHFDFKNKKYRIARRIAFITFGKWRHFEKLDYVAVYRKPDLLFEVKLFYDGGKNFYIESYFGFEKAVEVAKDLARNLELELWETTDFENPVKINPYNVIDMPELDKLPAKDKTTSKR